MKKSLTLAGLALAAAMVLMVTSPNGAVARALRTWEFPTFTLDSTQTMTVNGTAIFNGAESHTGTITNTGSTLSLMPAAETIAAAAVVTANACGGVKRITAASNVTTNTTNTFTAPAAANTGCVMDVVNVGTTTITLDYNILFNSAGAADVVLGSSDTVRIMSTGAAWYQIGATGNN